MSHGLEHDALIYGTNEALVDTLVPWLAGARVEELVLAVSELAGNTVRHAGGGGRLALWITPEGIVCEVTDRGGGVQDPLAGIVPPQPSASAAWACGSLVSLRLVRDRRSVAPLDRASRVRHVAGALEPMAPRGRG